MQRDEFEFLDGTGTEVRATNVVVHVSQSGLAPVDGLTAIDSTTVEVWTKGGLVTHYILFVMELTTSRVILCWHHTLS